MCMIDKVLKFKINASYAECSKVLTVKHVVSIVLVVKKWLTLLLTHLEELMMVVMTNIKRIVLGVLVSLN